MSILIKASKLSFNNLTAANAPEMCNLFEKFFSSVYTTNSVSFCDHNNIFSHCTIGSITLNERGVLTGLLNLNTSSSNGPDETPT